VPAIAWWKLPLRDEVKRTDSEIGAPIPGAATISESRSGAMNRAIRARSSSFALCWFAQSWSFALRFLESRNEFRIAQWNA